jgi:hypothetical protein
MCNVDTN